MARWGEYELLDKIGEGAFGAVYRSFHPTLGQQVALKLVPVPAHSARAIDKALEEARRLASVRHHHVVVVHDARYADGHVGICMEYVRGQSLDEMVAHQGPSDPNEATAYVTTLAGALSAVHRAQIVHNDVKARNVIRETGGRIVLMDFGAGRRLQEPNASTGLTVVGTPLYMAPELFQLRDPSASSDVYSLGVLWFYLLTGEYPVVGETLPELADAHACGRRRFVGDFRDDVPPNVLRAIGRALDPDRAARYRSCGALLHDLSGQTSVLESGSPPAPAPVKNSGELAAATARSLPAPAPPIRVEDGVLIAAGGIAAVILGIGAIGFLASKAYAIMFGLDREFARESPLIWLETGVRTLPFLLFYVLVALIGWAAVSLCWRVASRNSAIGALSQRLSRSLLTASQRVGVDDASSSATLLLIAQSIALVILGWTGRGVIDAFTTPVVDHAIASHALLDVTNDGRWLEFRRGMCLLTLVGGYGWWVALRQRGLRQIGLTRAAAGIALTAVSLCMATVPWRIVQEGTVEVATFGSDRCFVLAENARRVQLYCPGALQPVLIVEASNPRLARLGTKGNVFIAAAASARLPGGS